MKNTHALHQLDLFSSHEPEEPAPELLLLDMIDREGPDLPAVVRRALKRFGWSYDRTEQREDTWLHVFIVEPSRWMAGGEMGKTTGGAILTWRALAGLCWRCGGTLATPDEVLHEVCTACEVVRD